jgi:transcriptional regulator with XRE-family HTH domain
MNETRYPLLHLRTWREYREISQAQLAEKSGVGRTTIARLETGKHEANGVTVAKLARGLEISREELLDAPQQTAPVVTGGRTADDRAVLSSGTASA